MSATVLLVRDRVPAPPRTPAASLGPESINNTIRFLHPSYPEHLNTFLSLPRVDPTCSTASPVFGVHHNTALIACQIVANNAFETGRLYFDAEGRRPVEASIPLDGVLSDREYWLVVDGDANYPIVPSFEDWQFPHRRVPYSWQATGSLDTPSRISSSSTSPSPPLASEQITSDRTLISPVTLAATPFGASVEPQQRCVLTSSSCGLTRAHIVPREADVWFRTNGMAVYGADVHVVDTEDRANAVPLRADLHKEFDARAFCIVPKPLRATMFQTSATGQNTDSAEHDGQVTRRPANYEPGEVQEPGPLLSERSSLNTQTLQERQKRQYVFHLLRSARRPPYNELHHEFHNRPLSGSSSSPSALSDVAHEYLFARFAWAIFLNVKAFVTTGFDRRVARFRIFNDGVDGQTNARLPSIPEMKIQDLSGNELRDLYSGGGSRRSSPKKRGRDSRERRDAPATSAGWDSETDLDGQMSGADKPQRADDDSGDSGEDVDPWTRDQRWGSRWYDKVMHELAVENEQRTRGRKRRRIGSEIDASEESSATGLIGIDLKNG